MSCTCERGRGEAMSCVHEGGQEGRPGVGADPGEACHGPLAFVVQGAFQCRIYVAAFMIEVRGACGFERVIVF